VAAEDVACPIRRRRNTAAARSSSPATTDARCEPGRAKSRSTANRAKPRCIIVQQCAAWLPTTRIIPKLFINGDPGTTLTGDARESSRAWPGQTESTVPGPHFLQEDAGQQVGDAIASPATTHDTRPASASRSIVWRRPSAPDFTRPRPALGVPVRCGSGPLPIKEPIAANSRSFRDDRPRRLNDTATGSSARIVRKGASNGTSMIIG
jgi:hypothetical protein